MNRYLSQLSVDHEALGKETINDNESQSNKQNEGASPTVGFRKGRPLILNTFNTSYPVIDLVAKELGFKTVYREHHLRAYAEAKHQ